MTKSYRPSNATEGFQFEDKFCSQCTRDTYDIETEKGEFCEIQSLTVMFNINDANYPEQWIYDEYGKPICTAFTQDPTKYRCDKTVDMFQEKSDPAKDYVHSQFSGPITKVPFTSPEEGYLKCCSCGTVSEFKENLTYEEQSCCIHEECDGQMFCNKWPNWQLDQ